MSLCALFYIFFFYIFLFIRCASSSMLPSSTSRIILLLFLSSPSVNMFSSVIYRGSGIFFLLFLWDFLDSMILLFSLFRMNLIKIATKRTLMNTSSQVNWLAKKLAVLNNSWYFPLIFCPSVLYTVPSEANSYKEPEDKDSNVYELMLNLYSLVRKMSNCWGKYRLTKTMMDISWIS